MKILVTGCAGFIGSAITKVLISRNQQIVGIDNLNNYYDIKLKEARLAHLNSSPAFKFYKCNIEDSQAMMAIFLREHPTKVIHLAAQAGVRYSLDNPMVYIQSNLVGFGNVLEACRHHQVRHLVYASSSSVYGNNRRLPFKTTDSTDQPTSLYAATKKSNELMAYAYHHLYGLITTGIRYFTVYGPWGRPDMAPIIFTKNIIKGQAINLYNSGNHQRDFTYIDDAVSATLILLNRDQLINSDERASCKVYNVGFGKSINLLDFVEIIEQTIGIKAIKILDKKQTGDVDSTFADITELEKDTQFSPKVPLAIGIPQLVNWVRNYYQLSPTSET